MSDALIAAVTWALLITAAYMFGYLRGQERCHHLR